MDGQEKFWVNVWGILAGLLSFLVLMLVLSDSARYGLMVSLAEQGLKPMDYECARVTMHDDNLRTLCDQYFAGQAE